MEARILIVDDERLTRATLEVQLRDEGFGVLTAANGFEAVQVLEQEAIDVAVVDMRMPSMDGRELQHVMRERWPDIPVIFITAFGSVANAVEAMREGAADFLTKPLNADELLIRVRRLLERNRDIEEIRRLRTDALRHQSLGGFVFRSRKMAEVVERALAVAETDVTVLIQGETGTGKEVLARAIHERSARSSGPFVPVNCAGLNPNLVESELFGHEAGAFTGATRLRRGRFETAAAGTLLIDEVDDLTPDIQVRLLRFLQDKLFERVGSSRPIKGDARVVCATKRSLPELVRAGRFRDDLYYRINTVVLELPPLRARPEDILPLAEHFAARFSKAPANGAQLLAPEALQTLMAHDWPGNVRELEHAIEHAVAFARGAPIALSHLPPHLQPGSERQLVTLHLEGRESVPHAEVMATCERQLVDWALARTGGNQGRAAEMLHLSRTTFRGRLAALRAGRQDDIDAEEA